ncbi:hypothetical protein LguiA_033135 [Lonicera macranthoides]
MGNSVSFKMVELCTVGVQMFDCTVRTFSTVRYVPELKKSCLGNFLNILREIISTILMIKFICLMFKRDPWKGIG